MQKPKVDRVLLQSVAKNARLNLADSEIEKFLPQMKEILEAFSKLDEVNVDGVKPSFQPLPLQNVMRKDEVGKCLSEEDAFRNAKHRKQNYFKGPGVL